MVFFSCSACGENIKKPKMEKHLSHCGTQSVTCIDCCKDFTRSSYNSHNKCMTENERYGGKDYVEKGSKGDAKQKAWLEMITSCMKETNLSSSATRIWNNLESGGFENIPRKKSKFTNFLQNSMRVQDRKAIEEIWSVFEKAFQQQNKQTTTEVKKTPKKEPMKFDSSRPWYEQLSSGSSGKKQKKEQSSDSSSSSDEDTKKKPVKRAVQAAKPKAPPTKKSKKESSSSSSSSSEEEEQEKTQKKKVVKPKMKSTPKKKESSSDSSSSEEEEISKPEPPKKKVLKKTSPKKKAVSSSDSESSSEEDSKKKVSAPVKTPVKTPVKKSTKKDSSSSSSSSSEEETTKSPVKKGPVKKPAANQKKEESSSSSSSSEDEAPKKVVKPKPTVKKAAKKESSSEDSSSSEEEKPVVKKVEAKKVVPKKIQKKESSSSEDSSSSEEEKKAPVAIKTAPKKASVTEKKVESSSSDSSSSEDEKPAPKKAKTVKTPVAKKESSSDDSSSSEEEKPAPKKTKVQKPVSKTESSSSSGSSESEDEKPVAKKETKPKVSNGTKRKADSDSSSDEEPVKKVPLKQIVKPDTDKMKKPQKTNNNNFAKKEIKPLENDYRSERDQRTIFVKNLPFSSSVDDLWEVFAKSEEDVIDCRFCIDRNTGNHKGLAFIEYSSKQFAEEALVEIFKVKGRIVNIMRAGLKKPEGGNTNQKKGNSDERDARTLFVKELPYTAEPDEVKEFFGAIDARFLRNPDGSAKGIAFVEFNTEKEALDAYNNEEGYEMNGRWLVVDRIQPRSQMKAGNRSDGNDRSKQSNGHAKAMDTSGPKKPRFNKWAGLAPSGGELDKKNGGIADFGGKKTTFDDSD